MENNSSEDFKAGDRVYKKGDIRKTAPWQEMIEES